MVKLRFFFACMVVTVSAFMGPAVAVALIPPTPEQIAEYKADGTMQERVAAAEAIGNDVVDPAVISGLRNRVLAAQGYPTLPAPPPGRQTGLTSLGAPKILAVCIDFPDYQATIPSSTMQARLDGPQNSADAAYPFESLRAFYQRSSYGKLDLRTTTYGWYRSPVPRSQIATTTASREKLITDALRYYDAQGADFSQYDNNRDGKIDYLMVYWTGPAGAWASFWWGYMTGFSSAAVAIDGVKPAAYSWQWPSAGAQDTPIHETGHALGLPDLYDYDTTVGPKGASGASDMMTNTSADHNAFSKWMMEWATPQFVSGPVRTVELNPSTQTGESLFVMPGASAATPFTECFFVENRQPEGNDKYWGASSGLTLWHLDARLSGSSFAWNNSYSAHKYLVVEEADLLSGTIEGGNGYDEVKDSWTPGRSFSPSSSPASKRYDGSDTGVAIDSIVFAGKKASLRAYIVGASDVQAPVTSASVADGWHNAETTVTLQSRDDSSGVAATWYRVDSGAWRQGTEAVVVAPAGGAGDGAHRVYFYSVDVAGNTESTKSVLVGIDTVPPSTSIASVTYAGSNASVVLGTADAGSGGSQTSWRVDGGPWTSGRSASFDAETSHVLEYFSVDVAGNTEAVRSRIIASVPHIWIEVPSTLLRPNYGPSALQGVVRYGEQPLAGVLVVLDRSADGVNWTNSTQGALTGIGGAFAFSISPTERCWYRVRYVPGVDRATATTVEVVPYAKLSKPSAPASVKRGRAFKVSGALAPRHGSAARVTVVFERYEAGAWVPRKTVSVATKPGSGGSVYSFKAKLSGKGKWRVTARHADSSHSASVSSSRSLRVK